MFRFLHLADIHLDTRFLSQSAELRKLLKQSQKDAFCRAIDCAVEQRVDCVLLGGDLFDQETLSFASERFLERQLGRLHAAQIPCVYATGNHDPGGEGYRSCQISWPETFHLLWQSRPQSVEIRSAEGRLLGRVVGAGHPTHHVSENLATEFPSPIGGVPNVGLLHTWVTSARTAENHDRYAPCGVEDLRQRGYAYWALGHVHLCQKVGDDVEAWYPGILQGRSFRETGVKGGLLVSLPESGPPQVEFKPFARACWETLSIGGLESVANLADFRLQAQKAFEKLQRGAGTQVQDWFVRVELNGASPLAHLLRDEENLQALTEDLRLELDIRHVELTTKLVPPTQVREAVDENLLLGEMVGLIEAARMDPALLLRLRPPTLAAHFSSQDEEPEYLKDLLEGLEYEVISRFIQERDAD